MRDAIDGASQGAPFFMEETGMKIVKQTGTVNTTASPGRKIQYLAIQYTAGVSSKAGSALGCAEWFANPESDGSADYIVDEETFVQYNPDPKNRYCHAVGGSRYNTKGGRLYGTAKNSNCISLEICSCNKRGAITYPNDPNYYFTDKVLKKAKEAVEYLMQLYRIDAGHVIRHYDVNGKCCPGIIGWNADSGDESKWLSFKTMLSGGLQASCLYTMSEADVVSLVGPLCSADMGKSGILASVTMAQFILESGYGKTELAQGANNCFGMKASLSGNTWEGSAWDGKSVYTKKTLEDDGRGNLYTVTADFRKYPRIEDSIADHSAYLLGAKNGSKLRYAGLKGETDYRKAIQLIKTGGYATDTKYVDKICSIIERWNLTQYDNEQAEVKETVWYRVRKSWDDSKSQKGAYKILDNAKKCADSNPGFSVYDPNGKALYTSEESAAEEPFLVKVSTARLNIRTGPGTDFERTGEFTGIGIFTIVGTAPGDGSSSGWGRLKSGAGWIALDYTERI